MRHQAARGPLWPKDSIPSHSGPFRDNVESFLQSFGSPVALPANLPHTAAWVVPLSGVELHVYRETHAPPGSPADAVCDSCRNIGWQHHPISTRRFHFVVPAAMGPQSTADALSLAGVVSHLHAALANGTAPRSASAKAPKLAAAKTDASTVGAAAASFAGSEDDASARGADCLVLPPEEEGEPAERAAGTPFSAAPSIYDSRSHLLHGVLHQNGFGHLLRVNGLEGGAQNISGRQLMDLWDGLCIALRARQVTVEDVSNKGGVELRVLYVAAFKESWYGRWGYGFGRAGFGIKPANWRRAATAVHDTSLAARLQASPGDTIVPARIVSRYQNEKPGVIRKGAPHGTLGGFLARMVHLLSHPDEAAPLLAPPAAAAHVATPAELRAPQKSGGKSKKGAKAQCIDAAAKAPSEAVVSNGTTTAAAAAAAASPKPPPLPRLKQPGAEARALAGLRAVQPGAPLPRRAEALQPLQQLVLPKRWGRDVMQAAIQAALGALQETRGTWTPKEAVRLATRARLPNSADAALLDFAIRSISFRTWAGIAVYSEVDAATGQHFLLMEDASESAASPGGAAAAAHTGVAASSNGTLPPIPKLPVESRRRSVGEKRKADFEQEGGAGLDKAAKPDGGAAAVKPESGGSAGVAGPGTPASPPPVLRRGLRSRDAPAFGGSANMHAIGARAASLPGIKQEASSGAPSPALHSLRSRSGPDAAIDHSQQVEDASPTAAGRSGNRGPGADSSTSQPPAENGSTDNAEQTLQRLRSHTRDFSSPSPAASPAGAARDQAGGGRSPPASPLVSPRRQSCGKHSGKREGGSRLRSPSRHPTDHQHRLHDSGAKAPALKPLSLLLQPKPQRAAAKAADAANHALLTGSGGAGSPRYRSGTSPTAGAGASSRAWSDGEAGSLSKWGKYATRSARRSQPRSPAKAPPLAADDDLSAQCGMDTAAAEPTAAQAAEAVAASAAGAAPPLMADARVSAGGGTVGSRLRLEATQLALGLDASLYGRRRRTALVDYSEHKQRPATPPSPPPPPRPKPDREAKRPRSGKAEARKARRPPSAMLEPPPPSPAPPKKPWQLLVPGECFMQQQDAGAGAATVRDQVLADLAFFYDTCIRSAEPPPGVPGKVLCAPADMPDTFAAAVQVLRDTKHYVKDYGGGATDSDKAVLRLPVAVAMAPAPPAGAGSRVHGRRGLRSRRVPPPPEEVLHLPPGARVADLKQAAAAALAATYRMFAGFQVDRIEGLERTDPRSPAAARPGGAPLLLHGSGADASGAWRHAGGPEDWLVACGCGVRDDDGERMAACDGCAAWAHTRCAGVPDGAPVPARFLCGVCAGTGANPRQVAV